MYLTLKIKGLKNVSETVLNYMVISNHCHLIVFDNRCKDNKWTQSIAVGSKMFIEKMKEALGFRANTTNYAKQSQI